MQFVLFSVLLRVELRDKIENWIFPGEQERAKKLDGWIEFKVKWRETVDLVYSDIFILDYFCIKISDKSHCDFVFLIHRSLRRERGQDEKSHLNKQKTRIRKKFIGAANIFFSFDILFYTFAYMYITCGWIFFDGFFYRKG